MMYFIGFIITIFSLNLNAAAMLDEPLAVELGKAHFQQFLRQSELAGKFYHNVGYQISTGDFDDSIFIIGASLSPEMNQALPSKVKRLYEFLRENQLTANLGKMFMKDFTRRNPKSLVKNLRNFQKSIISEYVEEDKDFGEEVAINIITLKKAIGFDKNLEALIMLSDKGEALEQGVIKDELRIWLGRDPDSQKVLEHARSVNLEIEEKLRKLNNIINDEEFGERQIAQALQLSDDFPSLLKPGLRKGFNLERLKIKIKHALSVNDERINAIAKVFPSRLEIALLYSFFLIEESRNFQVNKAKDRMDILNAFGASGDDLSLTSVFAPIALSVLQELGFDPDAPEQADEEPKAAIKKQKNFKYKKKGARGGRRSKSSKSKAAKVNYSAKKEDLDGGSDEEKSMAPKELSYLQALGEMAEFAPLHLARKRESRRLVINSLSNHRSPKNIELALEKGHRLLDNLASLLSHELFGSNRISAGTLAMALVDQGGQDRLLIATKNNILDKYILEALAEALAQSARVYAEHEKNYSSTLSLNKVLSQTAKARLAKSAAQYSVEEQDDFHGGRFMVHRLRLAKALNQAAHNDELSKRIARLLNGGQIDVANIVILDNTFSMHPELLLAKYLRSNNLGLGSLNVSVNKKVVYQYVGSTLLNCAMCKGVLRGTGDIRGFNDDHNKVVIFTRGDYGIVYPGFVLPLECAHYNGRSCKQLIEKLERSGKFIDKKYQDRVTACQHADISDDSDEEEP